MNSAKILLQSRNFEDAIYLIYYSMYYSVLAILYKTGIKSENHTGTILLLKELFEIDNKLIVEAKEERIDKQYYIENGTNKEEVVKGIDNAETFNFKLKQKIDIMTISEKEKIIQKLNI